MSAPGTNTSSGFYAVRDEAGRVVRVGPVSFGGFALSKLAAGESVESVAADKIVGALNAETDALTDLENALRARRDQAVAHAARVDDAYAASASEALQFDDDHVEPLDELRPVEDRHAGAASRVVAFDDCGGDATGELVHRLLVRLEAVEARLDLIEAGQDLRVAHGGTLPQADTPEPAS